MKNVLRKFYLSAFVALAGVGPVACSSGSSAVSAATQKEAGGVATVRVVDGTGGPVPGVMVVVYPEAGPGVRAGTSNDRGEVSLPVQANAIYQFTRNGRTLLAQTSQNLFSLGPSAPHFYRNDGGAIIVPLSFAPTNSPLVSPVVDPMKTPPSSSTIIRVGE